MHMGYKITISKEQLMYLYNQLANIFTDLNILNQIDYIDYYNFKTFMQKLANKCFLVSNNELLPYHKQQTLSLTINEQNTLMFIIEISKVMNTTDAYLLATFISVVSQLQKQSMQHIDNFNLILLRNEANGPKAIKQAFEHPQIEASYI